MTKVYKIVSRVGPFRKSIMVEDRPTVEGARLTYGPKEWTKPVIGKIFAFASEITAQEYAANMREWLGGVELWEAEAKDVETFEEVPMPYADQDFYFEEFWKCHAQNLPRRSFVNLSPKDTVVCSKLKLVRKIA